MEIFRYSLLRYIVVLSVVLFVTFLYWFLYKQPFIGIDDANIYFVYIQNFVNGNGFVYNEGSERVEGFTSMFWILLISPLYLTGKYFEFSVLLMNCLLISYTLYRCILFLNKITGSDSFYSLQAFVFIAILCITPGFFEWTILSLMESSIWCFILVMITLQLCKDEIRGSGIWKISVGLALLVLIRPESILWGLVFIALLVLRSLADKNDLRAAWVICRIPLVTFIFTIACFTAFRVMYFGYPFPNTYYAKVSSNFVYNLIEGLRYFAFGIIQSPLLIIILLSVLSSQLFLLTKIYNQVKSGQIVILNLSEKIQYILTTVSLISLCIPIIIGGDHFKLLRFYQPFFPVYLLTLLNIPFWKSIVNINFNVKVWRLLPISLCLVFLYVLTKTPLHTFYKEGSPLDWEFRLAERGRLEGENMNSLFSNLDTLPKVGVCAAGGFSYEYNGYVYDLMGLNNVRMAHASPIKVGIKNHAAFDINTFFAQSPEIFHGYAKTSSFVTSLSDSLILENTPNFQKSFANRIYKGIFCDSSFIATYEPVIIYKGDKKLYLKTYCRKDYMSKLVAKGLYVKPLKRKAEPLQPILKDQVNHLVLQKDEN